MKPTDIEILDWIPERIPEEARNGNLYRLKRKMLEDIHRLRRSNQRLALAAVSGWAVVGILVAVWVVRRWL